MLATSQVVLNATTVTLAASVVIPAVTAAVTHLKAPNILKQLITLFFSTGLAVLTTATLANGTAVISWATATNALLSFLAATVAYLGGYKPKGGNDAILPNVGLGAPAAADPTPAPAAPGA